MNLSELAEEFKKMHIRYPDTIIISEITFHVLKLGKKKFRGKRRWFKKHDKEQRQWC